MSPPADQPPPPAPPPLAYGKQWLDAADRAAVDTVLQSDWLTNGPTVKAFESALAEFCGVKHAIACANGTAALHIALLALDIGPGKTGLTPALSFIASANAVAFTGGRPDFVDIDPDTRCMSVDRLQAWLDTHPAPAVVIPVSFAGLPAPLPQIQTLAARYGFKVVEDAAHSLGTTYDHAGRTYPSGSCAHSDLATLSFHPVKNITAGEGGAVLTNNDELARRARLFGCHGMNRDLPNLPPNTGAWHWEMELLGYNYRLSDIHCALGLSQLQKLPSRKIRRQEIVRRYNAAFAPLADRLRTPPWPGHCSPCFHLYAVETVGPWAERRRELWEGLKTFQVHAGVHYLPIHQHPYYRQTYGYRDGDFPAAEQYYRGCLSLPLYPRLTDADVGRVIEAVTTVLTR